MGQRSSLLVFIVTLFLTAGAGAAQDVAVCHFEGHADDFVTTGLGCGCLRLGGEIQIVDQAACVDTHAASGDCQDDNVGRLDCGPGVAGAWFGRAVPIDPFCTPGTEGCESRLKLLTFARSLSADGWSESGSTSDPITMELN